MTKVKLAEALLRRKELQSKVDLLSKFNCSDLFENKVRRISVNDSTDEVTAAVAKLTASQVTAELDWHSKQLRLVDAAIQQANWTTEIDVGDDVMRDYTDRMAVVKSGD